MVYSCKYHGVWCPQYRRSVWVRGVDERLKTLIPDVANERPVAVIEVEVMPDPVHRLSEVDAQLGVHKFIKQVKGRSSRRLRQEFPWLKKN